MIFPVHDKEVELKYSFRGFMIYENIEGHSFEPNSLTDVLVFFYATVLASSKDYSFTWDEFMDIIDTNPMLVTEFSNWIVTQGEASQRITPETKEDGKEKKKPKKASSK